MGEHLTAADGRDMDLAGMSLLETSDAIHKGLLSSEAVTAALLERIARLDPLLGAFVSVTQDQALAAAREADRDIAAGDWRGPLHGVAIGLKDMIDMAGVMTTGGMDPAIGWQAVADATVTARLRQAGAILPGKLVTTEAATFEHHASFRRPKNPWALDRWTGVSSSGSGVAVAAGLCHGAIGTDTGGSIRMPAAVNGLSGIMPTWGRVSRHGVFPLVESLDHVGPMARSLADAAAILQVIAGADPADRTSLCSPDAALFGEGQDKIGGRVIGYDPRLLEEDVDPLLADAVRETMEIFRSAGLIVREVRFPRLDHVGMETFGMMAEMAIAHEERFRDHSDRYGARLRAAVKAAAQVPGKDVARAYLARDRFVGEVNAAFRSIDMLLTPALPEPAPLWTDYDAVLDDMAAIGRRFTRFLSPFNIAHVPAIVFPIGQDGNGVPIAAQLVAASWQEALLCHTGMAFQAATTHHLRHPTL